MHLEVHLRSTLGLAVKLARHDAGGERAETPTRSLRQPPNSSAPPPRHCGVRIRLKRDAGHDGGGATGRLAGGRRPRRRRRRLAMDRHGDGGGRVLRGPMYSVAGQWRCRRFGVERAVVLCSATWRAGSTKFGLVRAKFSLRGRERDGGRSVWTVGRGELYTPPRRAQRGASAGPQAAPIDSPPHLRPRHPRSATPAKARPTPIALLGRRRCGLDAGRRPLGVVLRVVGDGGASLPPPCVVMLLAPFKAGVSLNACGLGASKSDRGKTLTRKSLKSRALWTPESHPWRSL